MSAEDCQNECVKYDGCNYWTWNSPAFTRLRNTCWLKAGKGTEKEVTNKISGPKKCTYRQHLHIPKAIIISHGKLIDISIYV